MAFERIGGEEAWSGRLFSVHVDRFRYDDGEEAERELAEEIGKGAREWRFLTRCFTSPGFANEEVHLYLATDLYDESAESGEDERIEVVTLPLHDLDEAIAACRDAKTLVGLLWFRAYERASA